MTTLTLTQHKAHLHLYKSFCSKTTLLDDHDWNGMPPSQLITDAAIDEVRAAHEERRAIRPGPKPIVYVSKPPPPPKPAASAAPEHPKQQQHNHNSIYGFKNSGWVTGTSEDIPLQTCTSILHCRTSPRKLQLHYGYL